MWRRRQCATCGSVITTHEAVDYGSAIAVQHSPKLLVPFSRDVLFVSIYESCKHRDNALDDASALTQTIIGLLLAHARHGKLDRGDLIAVATSVLERFDSTAATVYAAYHPLTRQPVTR
ncbi:MAG TPA: hypothetical protein VIR03_03025 [Candidatus Saccharimonadales bacterium]